MLLACCFSYAGQAQVSGLSYNLQPTVDYNWFDNQSGLSDGIMYGGRVGFGFGQNVELRALYMRSASFDTDFEDFDFNDQTNRLFLRSQTSI